MHESLIWNYGAILDSPSYYQHYLNITQNEQNWTTGCFPLDFIRVCTQMFTIRLQLGNSMNGIMDVRKCHEERLLKFSQFGKYPNKLWEKVLQAFMSSCARSIFPIQYYSLSRTEWHGQKKNYIRRMLLVHTNHIGNTSPSGEKINVFPLLNSVIKILILGRCST